MKVLFLLAALLLCSGVNYGQAQQLTDTTTSIAIGGTYHSGDVESGAGFNGGILFNKLIGFYAGYSIFSGEKEYYGAEIKGSSLLLGTEVYVPLSKQPAPFRISFSYSASFPSVEEFRLNNKVMSAEGHSNTAAIKISKTFKDVVPVGEILLGMAYTDTYLEFTLSKKKYKGFGQGHTVIFAGYSFGIPLTPPTMFVFNATVLRNNDIFSAQLKAQIQFDIIGQN